MNLPQFTGLFSFFSGEYNSNRNFKSQRETQAGSLGSQFIEQARSDP